MAYDPSEQGLVLDVFHAMFASVTKDGGQKRAAGIKPPWWRDPDHEKAIYSHLNKWKHGEQRDADSGAHPLVHLAWRAMAIAYQETYGKVDPAPEYMRRILGIGPDFQPLAPTLDTGAGPRPIFRRDPEIVLLGSRTDGEPVVPVLYPEVE